MRSQLAEPDSWRLVSSHDTIQIAKDTARGRRPDHEFSLCSTKKRTNEDYSSYECTTTGCLVSRKVSFDKPTGKWQLLQRGPKDHDHAASVRPRYPYTSAQLKVFEAYMVKTEDNPNPTPAGCYQAMVDQCPADSEGLELHHVRALVKAKRRHFFAWRGPAYPTLKQIQIASMSSRPQRPTMMNASDYSP